jgi:hypothetical protein
VSYCTQVPHQADLCISITGLSPSLAVRSRRVHLYTNFITARDITMRPYNPTIKKMWFGLFRVRSPLLTESR